jgi:hypothetical protein
VEKKLKREFELPALSEDLNQSSSFRFSLAINM